MEARELRIGNWVRSIGIEYMVRKIDALNNIQGIEGGTTFNLDKTATPIPLTEEWLLRFGFEKKHIGFELDSLLDIVLVFSNGVYEVTLRNEYGLTELKHVHQLQNLYFALTGEELTLKK